MWYKNRFVALSFLVTIFLLFHVSSGSAATQNPLDTDSAELLTIDKAIAYVQAANAEVTTARMDADNDAINLRLLKWQLRSIPADEIDSLELAQQKYISRAQSEMATSISSYYIQILEADVRQRAILSYYDLLNAYNEREWKKSRYLRVEELVQTAKDMSKRSKLASDVLQAETRAGSAKADWSAAQLKWGATKIKQNEFLGVDAEKEWKFSPDEEEAPIEPPIKLEDSIESANTDDINVVQRREEVQVAQLQANLFDRYSSLATFPGKIAKNNLEKAKIELEKAKRSAVFIMYDIYQNYDNGLRFKQTSKQAVVLAKEYFHVKAAQYKQGAATMSEVLQAEQELAYLENQHLVAMYDFNQTYANFQ